MSACCDDISEFLVISSQDGLKQMRIVDDKIVNALNTTIPTESFSMKIDAHATCKTLFVQLVESHTNRENALHQCLSQTSTNLQTLKEQKKAAPNDIQVLKRLRSEQSKFRELQTQINVEEVIRGRSLKIYTERCRAFYKPPQAI